MRRKTLVKVGGLIYWPAFVVAVTWIGFEMIFGKVPVGRWIDELPDRFFWPLAAIIFAGLVGILLVWWGQKGGK